MKFATYTFIDNKLVHNIDLKMSDNRKLGMGDIQILTYTFSLDQVKHNDLTKDSDNCFGCTYSFKLGKSGGCYTHKGLQGLGLRAKLKSLHNKYKLGKLHSFDSIAFDKFIDVCKQVNPNLLRLGAYGESILLGEYVITQLISVAKRHTGYTHIWHWQELDWAKNYFMASADSLIESNLANGLGWRTFSVTDTLANSVLCPASKQANYKNTCSNCSMCSGTSSKVVKDIFIPKH